MKRESVKKFIFPACLAIALFVTVFVIKKVYAPDSVKALFGGLSDCTFVPGILLAGVGLISWAGKNGTFDMFGYSSRLLFGHFVSSLNQNTPKTFYDYRLAKEEKGRRWLKEWLLIGGSCVVISLICILLYALL